MCDPGRRDYKRLDRSSLPGWLKAVGTLLLVEREPVAEPRGDFAETGRLGSPRRVLRDLDRSIEPPRRRVRRRQGVENREVAAAGCGGGTLRERYGFVFVSKRGFNSTNSP